MSEPNHLHPTDAPDPAPSPRPPFSIAELRQWLTANRARMQILLIAGLAFGGIVCMLVTVVVLLVRSGQ